MKKKLYDFTKIKTSRFVGGRKALNKDLLKAVMPLLREIHKDYLKPGRWDANNSFINFIDYLEKLLELEK